LCFVVAIDFLNDFIAEEAMILGAFEKEVGEFCIN